MFGCTPWSAFVARWPPVGSRIVLREWNYDLAPGSGR